MKRTQTNRAAIYIRDSSTIPGTDDRHNSQSEKLRTYCADRGLDVTTEYRDASGGREAFQAMMEDAAGGNDAFECIVVCNNSRFSRSVTQLEECRNRLDAHGIKLVSVT